MKTTHYIIINNNTIQYQIWFDKIRNCYSTNFLLKLSKYGIKLNHNIFLKELQLIKSL